MTYFTCLTCSPHSTLDHGFYGDKSCLFPNCPCQKMLDGTPFTKKPYVPLSIEDSLKRAAERGKEEPDS